MSHDWKADPILRRLVQERLPSSHLGAEIQVARSSPVQDGVLVKVVALDALLFISGMDLCAAGWKSPRPEPLDLVKLAWEGP
jgi:hypothetical protein